jgi:hypothetical protein
MSAEAVRALLAPAANASLLALGPGVASAFGGHEDQPAHAAFLALAERALAPTRWCSECHPVGCAALLPPDVLARGAVSPTRGVHDKFCADFQRPAPLPWPPGASDGTAA